MKKLIILFAILMSLSVSATDYYYNQSGGNDANDCSTPALACKTITDLNTKALTAGDTVYFARGETWRTISEYDAEIVTRTGSAAGNVTYRAYGSGPPPIFMRSKEMNGAGNWSNIAGNIWKSTVTFSDDVGVCVFNNSLNRYATKVEATGSNLNSQNKFYYNTTDDRIYIYSVGNPATLHNDIECSKKGNVFNILKKNYIVVRDLDMRYSAKTCVYMEDVHHIEILNNSCLFGGGSYQTGTLRYGNCIEFVSDANYSKVNYNNVTQCWDAGVSNQDAAAGKYIDIEYKYNLIQYTGYCYEFFNKASTSITMNNVFDHNTCYKSGYGFNPGTYGRNFRTGINAGHLSGFNITNNIMLDSSQYSIQIESVFNDTNLYLDYNLYHESSPSSGFIDWKRTYYTYSQFATYQADKNQDLNSITADPLLNYTTMRPGTDSPACGNASDGSDIGALPCFSDEGEPAPPETSPIELSGDCNTICYGDSGYYNFTLREGVIENLFYYNLTGTRISRNGTALNGANLGQLFAGDAQIDAGISSTDCVPSNHTTYLAINCTNGIHNKNNWLFFPTYLGADSTITNDTYRIYFYVNNNMSNPRFTNGTNNVSQNAYATTNSASGTAAFWDSQDSTHILKALVWDQTKVTSFDYGNGSTSSPIYDKWSVISLGRSSEISSGETVRWYLKIIKWNISQTGDNKILQPLSAFKSNPLYGDTPEEEEPPTPPTVNYTQTIPYSMTFETGTNISVWQTYDNSSGNNCYAGTASNKANWSIQEGDDDTYYGTGSMTMYGVAPDANYIAYLQTPVFILNGSPVYIHYNWRHNYEINYDGSYIEYMFNNSGTWTKVTTTTAVNFTIAPYSTYDGYGGYGRSQSACHGNFFSTDKGEFMVNLTTIPSTGNLTLRFNTIGDANTLCTTPPCGAWLDDFNITYSPLGESEPPAPPAIVYPTTIFADRALFIRSGVMWI